MQATHGASRYALSRRPRDGADRGVAAVEFAILTPFLLMVVFGVIAFGLALAQSAALAGGAREGARLGAVNVAAAGTVDHDCRDVVDRARAEAAQTVGVTPLEVGVTVVRTPAGDAGSGCVAAVGGASPAATPGVGPCSKATAALTDEATVKVTTRLEDREFIIPVPGGQVLTPDTLTKTAEYRCAYH